MSMLSVGSDSRRPGGVRACVLPLLVFFVFVVGYLIGSWSSPLSTNPVSYRSREPHVDAKWQNEDSPGNQRANSRSNPVLPRPTANPNDNFSRDTQRSRASDVAVKKSKRKAEKVKSVHFLQDVTTYLDELEPNANRYVGDASPEYIHSGKSKLHPANPRGSTVKTRRQPSEYEIVVSHYNEPLDWLKPYAEQAGHVYHKGLDKGPPFDMYKWEKLPNVGREAHTYLHHIIENYYSLADVTVFLQGHGPSLDQTWCFADPMEFVSKAKKNIFCKRQGSFSGWDRINHFGKWLKALGSGEMRPADLTVSEFYTALFGSQPPLAVPRCFAGCFSATRENLQRHPLKFYQRAISFVNNHSNPEEAHYFERLWAAIINVK
ncbi:uncharacterized protein LOC110975458 isoform X1 [Acanthaster planci]|uniref:Uncharacterized protein LOC110975458 isoform X1 n=1 Tax=Acanthaster planci TaxID=133434 RepID=A0A8B7XUT6_ACAPL|nr:uncharacterized protein LOC110975458 isoform X1 [Acanthaster planci]